LVASDRAFGPAAEYLHAFWGSAVAVATLRQHCQPAGRRRAAGPPASSAVAAVFARAGGAGACQLDAAKVNTPEAWCAFPVACFAKRPRGAAVSVAAWDQRPRPARPARPLVAALEPIAVFHKRGRPRAVWLGVTEPPAVHARGDGAAWLWNAVDRPFPGSRQPRDVYHGHEHSGNATQAWYGEGTPAATASFERGQRALVERAWPGVCTSGGEEFAGGDTPARRAARQDRLGSFAKPVGRLDYRGGRAAGGALGSGLVEGNIQPRGLRRKTREARKRVGDVAKRAGRGGLRHSTYWEADWQSPN
jgi:hypothetical protein